MDPNEEKEKFLRGIEYYLYINQINKSLFIKECKELFPETDGRCLHMVYIDSDFLGDGWGWGYVINPLVCPVSIKRLRELIDPEGDVVTDTNKITKLVNEEYDPNKEVVFFFICDTVGAVLRVL